MSNYHVVYYESYYGDKEKVAKDIEDCPECGVKLVITHWSDAGNLYVEENSRCIECKYVPKKVLHTMN